MIRALAIGLALAIPGVPAAALSGCNQPPPPPPCSVLIKQPDHRVFLPVPGITHGMYQALNPDTPNPIEWYWECFNRWVVNKVPAGVIYPKAPVFPVYLGSPNIGLTGDGRFTIWGVWTSDARLEQATTWDISTLVARGVLQERN